MQVDDAGQHKKSAGIDVERAAAGVLTDGAYLASCNLQAGFDKLIAEQRPATPDENVGHEAAP